ncbi:MAG: hypothetical protein VZS44_03440 [Bacilli bacterium]|nr:hypothetical protein [Bacilli bacterium]
MPKKAKEKKLKGQKRKKETEDKKSKVNSIISKLNKQKLYYNIIAIIDISFIIYFARHNYANYVTTKADGSFFIGDSKDLLFGKNYITLIFSSFIYIYILLSYKIHFNIKKTKKEIFILFIKVFLINIILFCIFTKRIY